MLLHNSDKFLDKILYISAWQVGQLVSVVLLQDDPQQKLNILLTLKWRRGKDMPIKMGSSVQSVVIGDLVYVGGGEADIDHDMCSYSDEAQPPAR